MSGDLTPQHPDLRMSDADRERVVTRLHAAVAEGRLTLDEFQERVDGVLKSRTYREVERYLADLPADPHGPPAPPRQVTELRATATTLRRVGRWTVPRRLVVRGRAGSARLDFTEAEIGFPVVDVVLDMLAGSTTLVLPDRASVNTEGVEMIAGSLKVRKVPTEPDPAGTHFVVTGAQRFGSLTIRRRYRFLHWRW